MVQRTGLCSSSSSIQVGIPVEVQKVDFDKRMSRIVVPDIAYEKMCSVRKKSLIGKFMGNRPILENIRKWMKSVWRVKGEVTLATLSLDFLMFNFNNEEDLTWVMENGPWWFGKSGLHLKKWYEGFNPNTESFSVMPMWVSLPKLPLDFWFEEAIVGIASTMGEFICMDYNTKMGQTFQSARFYVNVNINNPMKSKICLQNRNGEHIQDICFDIPPMMCKSCNKYGHGEPECPSKIKQINVQGNGTSKSNKRYNTVWRPT